MFLLLNLEWVLAMAAGKVTVMLPVGVFTFHYSFIGKLAPVAQATTVLLVMWYLCYWLYKRRIFLKL